MKFQIRANERIRVPQVRLIDEDGKQLGVVDTSQALERAQDVDLDLVEVAATSSPPVCRILDYGKYVYTLKKQERESRRNQKTAGLKEVKFSLKIGIHDYDMKINHAKAFLEKGHKVKTTMFLRGREITRAELGFEIMKRVAKDLENEGALEKSPNLEGKIISLMFAPKSGKTSPSKGRKQEDGSKKAEVKDEQGSEQKV